MQYLTLASDERLSAEMSLVEPMDQEHSRKPSVLVVDDDRLVRLMLQLGLQRNGLDVWLAANGREAIELYQEVHQRIDVVLLDVRMPELDGPTTLDALRKLNPNIRACFMSGDVGKYKLEDLLQRGASCVIAKPFHLGCLSEVLRTVANGGSVS